MNFLAKEFGTFLLATSWVLAYWRTQGLFFLTRPRSGVPEIYSYLNQ